MITLQNAGLLDIILWTFIDVILEKEKKQWFEVMWGTNILS